MFAAYLLEAEWMNQNYVPTFSEYWRNAVLTIRTFACAAGFILGMRGDILTKDTFDWLKTGPKLVKASFSIVRLGDDLIAHQV